MKVPKEKGPGEDQFAEAGAGHDQDPRRYARGVFLWSAAIYFAALVSRYSGGRGRRNRDTREGGEIDRRTPKEKQTNPAGVTRRGCVLDKGRRESTVGSGIM